MKKAHPKYKIKKGDTIDIISNKFGVHSDIWLRYHNNMCRLSDVIRTSIPRDLQEIYLLPQLWDNIIQINYEVKSENPDIKKEKELGYNNSLFLKYMNKELLYGVKIEFDKNNERNTIKYQIKVRWIGKENDNYIVEINRIKPLYINNKEIDLLADRLAVDSFQSVYPICLEINKNGELISVRNFESVKNRWNSSLEEIKKGREGEILDKYISLCSKGLENEKTFISKIQNDFFIKSYFFGIYQIYGQEYQIERDYKFPVIHDIDSFYYKINQEINTTIDKYGLIEVTAIGNPFHEKFEINENEEFNIVHEPLQGSFFSKFFIDSQTHVIESAMITAELFFNTQQQITIKISNLNNRNV